MAHPRNRSSGAGAQTVGVELAAGTGPRALIELAFLVKANLQPA